MKVAPHPEILALLRSHPPVHMSFKEKGSFMPLYSPCKNSWGCSLICQMYTKQEKGPGRCVQVIVFISFFHMMVVEVALENERAVSSFL